MYIFAQAIVFGKIFPYNKTVSFELVQLRTSIGKEKFPMITINMLSRADSVKGQGVLSAYQEQVKLVKEELADEFLCHAAALPGQERFGGLCAFPARNPG